MQKIGTPFEPVFYSTPSQDPTSIFSVDYLYSKEASSILLLSVHLEGYKAPRAADVGG